MTFSFKPPVGAPKALDAPTDEFLKRCLSALQRRFYGFNIIVVPVGIVPEASLQRVLEIMWDLSWSCVVHDFCEHDRSGRSTYNLGRGETRERELWFFCDEAKRRGIWHLESTMEFAGVYPTCAKSILYRRSELVNQRLKQDSCGFGWPKLSGVPSPRVMTRRARRLYFRCVSSLQHQYVGFNEVWVQCSQFNDQEVSAVRIALQKLGWIPTVRNHEGKNYLTIYTMDAPHFETARFDSKRQIRPDEFASNWAYRATPEQILYLYSQHQYANQEGTQT